MNNTNIHNATTVNEIIEANHLHFGKLDTINILFIFFGIFTSKSRKLYSIDSVFEKKTESVAIRIDIERFMITISKRFILLTLREGDARFPIIKSRWRLIQRNKAEGFSAMFGTVDTYIDSSNLKWQHYYNRSDMPDELIAYDSSNNESILFSLETIK